jgi:hypothetical protein
MVLESLKTLELARESVAEADKSGKYKKLKNTVQKWMTAWPNQNSQTDLLRASGMHFVCPREFVLNYWSPQANRSFDFKAQFMMTVGTHLHTYLQDRVLGPMGILFGKWKSADEVVNGFHPDMIGDMRRAAQGVRAEWTYVEPTVWNEKYRISGHVDGVVCTNRLSFVEKQANLFKTDPEEACKRLHDLEMGEMALLEIKTTGSYVMKSIKSADDIADYYKTQASIYQKLMDIPRTLFWFIERDTVQSKTFLYHYEPARWKDATMKAKIIWEAIRDRTLPESRMACTVPTDTRAKKCVHADQCWKRISGAKPTWVSAELPFEDWVEKCISEQPDRKFLDLEGTSFDAL